MEKGGFYPTALKGRRGIVFTHGVQMGKLAPRKVCLGWISETKRCRKFILAGTLVGGVGVQCHGVTLIGPLTLV